MRSKCFGTIAEAQSELAESVDTAQEVAAYEPEEDESITAAVIKKALKDLINDLKGTEGASAKKELKKLEAQEDAIIAIEKRIRASKTELKTLTDELEHKLQLKRLGGGEFKAESEQLLKNANQWISTLDESKKDDKKKITALKKDKAALEARLAKTDALLASIGGHLTEAQAKTLILKKLFDLGDEILSRYFNAQKRQFISLNESLWEKYAASKLTLDLARNATLNNVNRFLSALGYLP